MSLVSYLAWGAIVKVRACESDECSKVPVSVAVGAFVNASASVTVANTMEIQPTDG